MKAKIIEFWRSINRPGIDDFISFLEGSDFFKAPCSTEHHLNIEGGLAIHSMHVYELLAEKIIRYGLQETIPRETAVIVGLGHDLCKIDFYERGFKWVKPNGTWEKQETWVVKDKLPFGHGEKSVSILQDCIKLTALEKLAIRWHMGAFTAGFPEDYATKCAFNEAMKNPLVALITTADFEATRILEQEAKDAANM
jgi:hypothetical protein